MKAKRPFLRAAGRKLAVVFAACAAMLLSHRADAQPTRDFGDAPDPYPTLEKDNGAFHTATGPVLGFVRDAEFDGLPSMFAQGDDFDNEDDEEGVVFLSALVPGQAASVQVTVSGAPNGARLDAWVDWGADGSWDAVDRVFGSTLLNNGVNTLNFQVPEAAKLGLSFARFRISFAGDLNPVGGASNGEVEDHRVGISPPMDFGDAPVTFGTAGGFNYPTLVSQNGARHRILDNFWLGQRIDTEPDGQPNIGATGDDANPAGVPDDEDGVFFLTALEAGKVATVEVFGTMAVNMTGRLNAWVDFNRDGDWNDEGEHIFRDEQIGQGVKVLDFLVPEYAVGGPTYARFRLNAEGKIGPGGFASDGEVEDYQVDIEAGLDFGDAPFDRELGFLYPTLLSEDGARHSFRPDFCLGKIVDGEIDGQPKEDALGDDLNPAGAADDEDGVTFTSSLAPGQSASVEVLVTLPPGVNGAFLHGWFDWNRDGDWDDEGEYVFSPRSVISGVNTATFIVPSNASQGATFARFRLSFSRSLSYNGLSDDGEVEDYAVNISGNLDYGDAPRPYPTLLAANGARHVYNPDVFLGLRVDTEPDGQPSADAKGDDNVGPDEDGVVFTSAIVAGGMATVQVRASTSGLLHAWLDFNGNESWGDSGEKIFSGVGLSSGVNNLSFPVPLNAVQGPTYARFRFTLQSQFLDFVGPAADGEVEDYLVSIIPDRERCDLTCMGREFWLTFPGNYAPAPDNPAKLSLCIQGTPGTTGFVTVGGIGFSNNFVIPANQTVSMPLPREAEMGDVNDSVTNNGIYVRASAPVSVTGFNHARHTTDSYLGLNASVIGTEYIVQGFGNVHSGFPPLNASQFALVACESNTVVTITPSVSTGVRVAGVPYNIILQPGETYQLRDTNNAPSDLSGTLIKSDKPIGVFGGHQHTTIPSNNEFFTDYIVEQLLPVNTWGNDFYTAPLATRSGDTLRILAAYDSTAILLNGVAQPLLNAGEFMEFQISVAARITANRPISVTQYANSGDYDGNMNADPFMLTVQATRHYATAYRLCTADSDFPANYVHIIAPSVATATILMDGAAVGAGSFTAIAGTSYSFARVPISAGPHIVTGGAPFSASVYGWAEYDSYGHPACFYFGDVARPSVNPSTTGATASTSDYPNSPGFVPTANFASTAVPQDNCSQDLPPPTQTPRPGVLLPPGVHTVTLSVVDNSGNVGTTNVTMTVVDPSPVTIECPRDIAVPCEDGTGAVVNFQVNAFTTYETNVSVVSTPPSGSVFPIGTTVVTNVATSLAGNTATCTFTVTVECSGEITVGVAPGGGALNLNWTGSPGALETAPTVLGPWQVYTSGVNSATVPIGTRSNAFFRVRH